jgi:hypothetical protein
MRLPEAGPWIGSSLVTQSRVAADRFRSKSSAPVVNAKAALIDLVSPELRIQPLKGEADPGSNRSKKRS